MAVGTEVCQQKRRGVRRLLKSTTGKIQSSTATKMHLMGIDHEQLSYLHQGSVETLTGVYGCMINKICT